MSRRPQAAWRGAHVGRSGSVSHSSLQPLSRVSCILPSPPSLSLSPCFSPLSSVSISGCLLPSLLPYLILYFFVPPLSPSFVPLTFSLFLPPSLCLPSPLLPLQPFHTFPFRADAHASAPLHLPPAPAPPLRSGSQARPRRAQLTADACLQPINAGMRGSLNKSLNLTRAPGQRLRCNLLPAINLHTLFCNNLILHTKAEGL